MWGPFKALFAKSRALGALLGEVVLSTPPVKGQSSHSFFQWRVKKGLDESSFFLSLAMKPDGYIGADGSPTNYINFDLPTALSLRVHLDECIAEIQKLNTKAVLLTDREA